MLCRPVHVSELKLAHLQVLFSSHHLGRITKGYSNNHNSESLTLYLTFINTTQLYSNLVIKYYLSVPCVGCPCVSKDLKGQACLAMHCSTFLSLYQNQYHRLMHSLANVSLLLILEDKEGPTPGH